jgi:mandelate racemase
MKVTRFKHRTVSVPVKYPVVSCVRRSDRIVFVLLDVETDEGITGIAYAQAFHPQGAQAIRSCLVLLEALVAGEDPRNIEKLWYRMWETTKLLGNQGLPAFAVSLVDIALWDILGKSIGLPVCRLLGGEPGIFEAYQSDGLWLVPPSEAAAQAEHFVGSGFRTLKMRLGRRKQEEDIQALRDIRRAVGERIELLGDVNQGWTVDTARSMAGPLAEYRLGWLEEPVEADYMEGYAELSQTVQIPIATGENLYGVRQFHRFMTMDAVSIYTPDLQRIGGISGWKRINVLIEQYGKVSSLHLFPEYAVHLFPVIRYPAKLEWMSWAGVLFAQPLDCTNGTVRTPDRPGFGMEWDEDAVAAYEIEK